MMDEKHGSSLDVKVNEMEDGSSNNDKESFKKNEPNIKETWSRHLEFLLSCIGYAVGFGAFWRFPYICMRNGGGAFLIPYFICLILCGMPLFFLELAIGQFSGLGPLAIWNICPLLKGIGWSMMIMSGMVTIYSSMTLAWVFYFLANSFQSPVPWASCGNSWNTANCLERGKDSNYTFYHTSFNESCSLNGTCYTNDTISFNKSENILTRKMTAAEEFWQYNVLDISSGIGEMGQVRLSLLACLFATWVAVFLCLFKGIKWSGKVVYVTATLPYVFLTILLIRACMLPGALQGIIYYVQPDFAQLKSPKVWAEACLQIFYSLGPTWGGLIAMSRYNKFNNNCLKDSIVICLVCCGTSFYSGFICFSILGFMAYNIGTSVPEVITTGPGLIFSVYPEAIAQMPLSPLWAVSFFLMLLTIGLDSLFGMIETCTSGLVDEFPDFLQKKRGRLTGILCFIIFLCGIPLTTRAGMYIFQILDWYLAAFAAMIIAFLECLVLGHIYGTTKLYDDIESMLGNRVSVWWKICWKYITPVIMLALFLYSCIQMAPPTYGEYEYPWWSIMVGWLVACCPILPIPLYAIYRLAVEDESFIVSLKNLLRPPTRNFINKQDSTAVFLTNF